MKVDEKHSFYLQALRLRDSIQNAMFEMSGGKLYDVRIRFLSNMDIQFSSKQCYRGCRESCFRVINKCVGTLISRSYCISQLPDAGDIAQEMLDYTQLYCEANRCERAESGLNRNSNTQVPS